MDRKTVKQRVLDVLLAASWDAMTFNHGHIFYNQQIVYHKDGWVPQSVLANPTITNSTEGKRRFRELRADPELQKKYIFEIRHRGRHYEYRILPKNDEDNL